MFYQDLFYCVFAWWRSRRWWRMSLIAFLPLSLLLISCSLVVYGAMLSRQTLAARYLALVQDDLEASFNELLKADGTAVSAPQATSGQSATPKDGNSPEGIGSVADSAAVRQGEAAGVASAEATQPVGAAARVDQRHVQVPLRRMLQLGNFNPRVAFVVASQMARQGRLGMAARMMRDIAPLNNKEGFAYAHAWLSDYAMLNWKGTEAQVEVLLGDLQAAERGGVTLTFGQVRNYVSLLIQSKRTQEAEVVLRDYAPLYPELNVQLASLAKQTGHTGVQYQDALTAGRQSFEGKRKAGELVPKDWVHAVQIEMLDGALERALVLARAGFESDMQNPSLRRLYSDVLLAKHRSLDTNLDSLSQASSAQTESPSEVSVDADGPVEPPAEVPTSLPELRYLEAACKVDSSNPALVPEVAKAVALGQRLTPRLKAALERSLADGTASGVTHLMLANNKLMGESPESSLPHLRLALRQMPHSPIVMNNLAYALMKYEPDKLDEALQLMERALSIPGGSVQERAAMLDTLGEIRLTQGETLAAIAVFEQAIELDGSKLGTRQHLVEAYQRAGMPELAAAQQQRITDLSSQKE